MSSETPSPEQLRALAHAAAESVARTAETLLAFTVAVEKALQAVRALPEGPGARQAGSPGVYVPGPCTLCGGDRGPGRNALTCRPCGRVYAESLKSAERITFIWCTNCGKDHKKPSSRMLCALCRESYKRWVADQGGGKR